MNYGRFTALWILLFVVLFAALSVFDMAPQRILKMNGKILSSLALTEDASADENAQNGIQTEKNTSAFGADASISGGVEPERMVIEKIGMSSPIMNPNTTDIGILDAELKRGVVRYPGSGLLNENSNMLLFGHSTGLKNVRNKAYQAFNDLGKLNIGDVIKIYSKDEVYEYRVASVSLAKAEEALVTFSTGKKMLTLSTCNTFGKKEDRFVVTAELAGQTRLTEDT